MSKRQRNGKERILSLTGEYQGIAYDAAGGALFEPYHYRTYRATFDGMHYVEDVHDGSYTSRDGVLATVLDVQDNERYRRQAARFLREQALGREVLDEITRLYT